MVGKKSKTARVVETEHDEIGFWSELKLDILRKYWPRYTQIVKNQRSDFRTLYIDAFAGSGQHISKSTREFVKGSPARALEVQPPFDEYHFIDMDEAKVRSLEQLASSEKRVTVHHGDCKSIEIFLNFPIMDMNRAVFHEKATPQKQEAMTRFCQNETGSKIVDWIFNDYRNKGFGR